MKCSMLCFLFPGLGFWKCRHCWCSRWVRTFWDGANEWATCWPWCPTEVHTQVYWCRKWGHHMVCSGRAVISLIFSHTCTVCNKILHNMPLRSISFLNWMQGIKIPIWNRNTSIHCSFFLVGCQWWYMEAGSDFLPHLPSPRQALHLPCWSHHWVWCVPTHSSCCHHWCWS